MLKSTPTLETKNNRDVMSDYILIEASTCEVILNYFILKVSKYYHGHRK